LVATERKFEIVPIFAPFLPTSEAADPILLRFAGIEEFGHFSVF